MFAANPRRLSGMDLDQIARPDRYLYKWQLEALTAWLACGRRGVIEAVTGSGKTDMAMAAISDAHRRELFILVIVPTRVLIAQWHERLTRAFPDMNIGRLGDSRRDRVGDCDVLVSTRHSAVSARPVPEQGRAGLLIADECHGFGGGVLRKSLIGDYEERLGLTATLERSDGAIENVILPYFGGICYRYGFAPAINDGVCAQPRVAFVSVPLEDDEREEYVKTEQQLVEARKVLKAIAEMPTAFVDYLAVVSKIAEEDSGSNGRAAREYLDALSRRREIVANSSAKYQALSALARAIKGSSGALVFTETVRAANHAINRLDTEVAIDIITGDTPRSTRQDILQGLRLGTLDAVAAPRVLDEGVDIPNADLGIVVSASRTRRQMIQRMGRILRPKAPGRGARFVILFASDTLEDPRNREDRDGFLEEIEEISDESAVFTMDELVELERFLDWSGPEHRPQATRFDSRRVLETESDRWDIMRSDVEDIPIAKDLMAQIGVEAMYARLSYLQWPNQTWLHSWVWERLESVQVPTELTLDAPYLEVERLPDIEIVRPKKKKRRLSTGESPVVVVKTAAGFGVRCVGCGATSDSVAFKWQALDQTVECECSAW